MIKWIDTECPECRSDRIFDNGHNEHVCHDCGECFYVSDHDETRNAKNEGRDASWHEGALAPIPLVPDCDK